MSNVATHCEPDALPAFIRQAAIELVPVGSRATCSPPPTDTDQDWLISCSSVEEFAATAATHGWSQTGSLSEAVVTGGFVSLKHAIDGIGEVNLIVTQDKEFFRKFVAASAFAKRMNLQSKDDRIALFQAVLYGQIWRGGAA